MYLNGQKLRVLGPIRFVFLYQIHRNITIYFKTFFYQYCPWNIQLPTQLTPTVKYLSTDTYGGTHSHLTDKLPLPFLYVNNIKFTTNLHSIEVMTQRPSVGPDTMQYCWKLCTDLVDCTLINYKILKETILSFLAPS